MAAAAEAPPPDVTPPGFDDDEELAGALAPRELRLRVETVGAQALTGCALLAPGAVYAPCRVDRGRFTFGRHAVELSPDVAVEEVCLRGAAAQGGAEPNVLVLQLTPPPGAAGVRAPVRVHGLDADARSALLAALRAERDTLAYLPAGCGLGAAFTAALVEALWRLFPRRPALRHAYFSRWHAEPAAPGGGAGPALFRALFRAFRSLVSCDALGDGSAAAAAFAELLAPASRSAVRVRQLLLARPLAPGALAAWARTLRPSGHDFAKLVHCAEAAQRELQRAKPWAPALLLDGAAPTDDLFGPEALVWFATAAAAPEPPPAQDVAAWLDALGVRSVLRLAQARARAGDLAGLAQLLARLPRTSSCCPEVAASLVTPRATYAALPLLLPRAADARAALELLTADDGGALRAAPAFAALLRAGLELGQLRMLCRVLEAALFEPDGVTPQRRWAAQLLAADPPFPALAADALQQHRAARGDGDDDLLCGVADVALRLQFSPAVLSAFTAEAAPPAGLWRRRPLPGPPVGHAALPALVCDQLPFERHLVALHDANLGALAAEAEDDEARDDADALDWHVRRRAPLLATFEAFCHMCLRHRPEALQALLRRMHGWQATLFRKLGDGSDAASLRARFVDLLRAVPPYCDVYAGEPGASAAGGFVGAMLTGELLEHHTHFSAAALTAMILPTRVLRGVDVTALATHARPPADDADDPEQVVVATPQVAPPADGLPADDVSEPAPPADSSNAVPPGGDAAPPPAPRRRGAFFSRSRWRSRGSDVAAAGDAVAAPPDSPPSPPPLNDAAPQPSEAPVIPPPPGTTRAADAHLVFELVELGLYLKKSDGLDRDVVELFVNMNDAKAGAAGAELHKRSVLLLLEDVRARRAAGTAAAFFDLRRAAAPAVLTLATINECACFARDALAMLAAQPVSQGKLRSVFSYYVQRAAPAAWTGLFKGTSTIAFFLKYLDRENYDQAFAAFADENADGARRDPGDAALFTLLIVPVACTYTAPLFKLEAATLSDEAKVQELIADIRAQGERDGETVLGMLRRITAGWMELSKQKFQVPMAPRNTQIISMLLCCEWVRRRLEGDASVPKEQRSFITRVGTGEGKSLIVAMIAIYLVRILKKKVHVMEANEALLLRDVAEMRAFYALFGISVSANFGGFLRDEKADVTYCCRRELNVYYRNFVSQRPLDGTVLVLDEVDQLIVDEKPNSSYVTKDMERSPEMKALFADFQAGGDGSLCADPVQRAKVKAAFTKGEELRRSGKFARVRDQDPRTGEDTDVYVELNDKGKPLKGFYFGSCEFLRYAFEGEDPEAKSFYFVQSMPFMMNQYEAILGLSGSLGSPSEQAFMRATYGVRTMATPPFLNTCQGMRKHVPQLHGGAVLVKNTWEEQVAEVRRLALESRNRVPVVILANDTASAKQLFADCFTAADAAAGTLQLFLELDPVTGKKSDYSSVIQEATRPRQSSASPSGCVWPVTVSDPFGGRGQDYTVLKEEVDDAGGIMVICTAIPDSEREWTQWLGRTARSDRRGQYAVVLLATAPLLAELPPAVLKRHQRGLTPGAYNADLITALLDERDKAIRTTLDDIGSELAMGKRLHELCYRFWNAQPGGCNVDEWPANEAQRKLRAFLERLPLWSETLAFAKRSGLPTEDLSTPARIALQTKCKAATVHTPDAIAAFAAEVGLARSAEDYKRTSEYCK